MVIVAIHRVQGPPDQRTRDLAAALDITPYEARSRIMGSGDGPCVVASFAAAEPAAACASRLEQAGFAALVLDSAEAETDAERFVVQQLHLEEHELQVINRAGEVMTLPYGDVVLLLRGVESHSTTETKTTTKKKLDAGRALLSGGLVMRKKVQIKTETTRQDRRPFCYVYAAGQRPLAVVQDRIDYACLGPDLQLSREANFGWICAELRRRCGAAVWDDRLQTRAGQSQLLGPALSPERYLELGVALTRMAHSRRL
ncbi:MAG: hypothetical protein ABI333_27700 [bacterium]